MIHYVTYIDSVKWRLSVYILERCGEGRDVLEELAAVGCRGVELADASAEVRRCGMDIGLTYSVGSLRNTILMIGLQDNKSEFVNTLRHEQHHVISHICQADGIDMHSEESAYIAGDVGEAMYNSLHELKVL